VLSSTSSSRPASPAGGWGRTWCLTILAGLAAVSALEATARAKGVTPSWSVGSESWSVEAAELGPRDVAIIGTSRILSGVEPEALSRRMGRPAHQLAINATSMLPVLEWLAAREDFEGLVLADVTPRLEFQEGFDRHAAAERFVRDFRDYFRSPARRLDSPLSRFVQTHLACRSPGFALLAPYRDRHASGGRLDRMTVEGTRFVRLEFRKDAGDPGEKEVQPASAAPAGPAELEVLFTRFATAARAIGRRGGRVVFLYMPVSGRLAVAEERDFPRVIYWDRLVAAAGAEAVHFKDMPELAYFTCPDGEHLDGPDAARFTEALASVLAARR